MQLTSSPISWPRSLEVAASDAPFEGLAASWEASQIVKLSPASAYSQCMLLAGIACNMHTVDIHRPQLKGLMYYSSLVATAVVLTMEVWLSDSQVER